jgi:hypothetical protein
MHFLKRSGKEKTKMLHAFHAMQFHLHETTASCKVSWEDVIVEVENI